LEITVSARNIDVSESLRQSVVEKIGRLSRFLEGMDHAEVHFFEERNPRIADREVCEVVLVGHGHHVRCKVAAPDGFAAIDKAVGKLEHQLHKLKTKLLRRQHGGARGRQAVANGGGVGSPAGRGDATGVAGTATVADTDTFLDADAFLDADTEDEADGDGGAALEEGAGPRIVKVKRHALRPMAPEEAMLQLELVSHDFYFFTNAETGRAAVLYRRDDGDLGLIDEAG
jgi:putative sigma-54 modulation protein